FPGLSGDFHRENLWTNDALGYTRHAAGHADDKIIADFDLDDAAWAMHGDIAVHEAEFVRHRRRGAAAAAAGKRVARAALPNLNLDVRAIQNFHELDVGLARKIGMHFQQRSKFFCHRFADFW